MSEELIKFKYYYKLDNRKNLYYLSSMDIDFAESLLDSNKNYFNCINITKDENFNSLYKLKRIYKFDEFDSAPRVESVSYYADWYLLNASISDLINSPLPVIYTSKSICKDIIPHENYYSFYINTNNRTIELKFDNNTIIAVYDNGTITIYQYNYDERHVGIYGPNFINKYSIDRGKSLIVETVGENTNRRSYQVIDLESGAYTYYSYTFDIFGSNFNEGPGKWWPLYFTKEALDDYQYKTYYSEDFFNTKLPIRRVLNKFYPEYDFNTNKYTVDHRIINVNSDDGETNYDIYMEMTFYEK